MNNTSNVLHRRSLQRVQAKLRALLPALFSGAAAAVLAGGCVYDADDRCGTNMELQGDSCVCLPNHAKVDKQCVECGANEEPGDGECTCIAGYERGANGDCQVDVPGLGDACTTNSDCPGGSDGAGGAGGSGGASDSETANVCYVPEGEAEGECTIDGCDTHLDCFRNYGCEVETGICVPPPTGFESSCSTSADCEGFEASVCQPLDGICMQECLTNPSICQGDWVCCDYTTLGIGDVTGICVPPDELESDGSCPQGGDLVEVE